MTYIIKDMKTCYKCEVQKEDQDFSKNPRNSDGLNSQCKECHRSYRKEHYERNKEKYIKKAADWKRQAKLDFYDWLSTQSCKDCGITDIRVLELDHQRDKSGNISEMMAVSPKEVFWREVAKCEVVCANCHKIRTSVNFNWLKAGLA